MRWRAVFATLLGATAVAGCGGSRDSGAERARVFAASSLEQVFPRIASSGRATYSFAGSDALAFQIERGAPADVYAAAGAQLPRRLERRGLCQRPVTFATNVLVMIVPGSGSAPVASLDELARGDRRRIAVGQPGVPVGQYARDLLRSLDREGILRRNRVSSEADAAGIVAKVRLGSADAGFVYRSDALSAGPAVRTVTLPRSAQPSIRYRMCAVRRPGRRAAGARRFMRAVTGPRGRALLRAQGFGVPAP